MSEVEQIEEAQKDQLTAKPRPAATFLSPTNLILTVAAIGALVFLVLYYRQNASLAQTNEDLRERVAAYSTYLTAQVGDAVPPIESVDLKGNPAKVNYVGSGKKHLLFIFTTHCPACLDQLPKWDSISQQAASPSSVVLGISVDSREETLANLSGNFTHLNTIIAPDNNFTRTYRVNAFPQVMIISSQGVVEWVHIGKLDDGQVNEMLAKLKT